MGFGGEVLGEDGVIKGLDGLQEVGIFFSIFGIESGHLSDHLLGVIVVIEVGSIVEVDSVKRV